MEHELWRQWQAFAALMSPAGAAAPESGGAGAFAPFIESAKRFTDAARSFFATGALGTSPAAAAAAQNFSEALRDQFAAFPFGAGTAHGAAGAQPPFSADAPALGATREHQQRWQRVNAAWRRIEAAQRRMQRLWSDQLRAAAAAFVAKQAAAQPAAAGAEGLRKLYENWIDCAENAYARTVHEDGFCDALAEYVNASSQLRAELQAAFEYWAKQLDLPTRSEINTLTRRLRVAEDQLRAARPAPKFAASPAPRATAPGKKSPAAPRSRAAQSSPAPESPVAHRARAASRANRRVRRKRKP